MGKTHYPPIFDRPANAWARLAALVIGVCLGVRPAYGQVDLRNVFRLPREPSPVSQQPTHHARTTQSAESHYTTQTTTRRKSASAGPLATQNRRRSAASAAPVAPAEFQASRHGAQQNPGGYTVSPEAPRQQGDTLFRTGASPEECYSTDEDRADHVVRTVHRCLNDCGFAVNTCSGGRRDKICRCS
jgi:hypothetical protein